MKKRVLLFSHACNGFGHLRRISRIAEEIQNDFVVLIITGMRDGFWMIPTETEVMYFPSWNSLRKKRADHWNRRPWLNLELKEALKFRSNLICNAVMEFNPDAILVDYLPFGLHDELRETLTKSQSKKYLILRGIIDTSDTEIFFNEKSMEIASTYERILIAADKKIIDFEKEYKLHHSLIDKLTYTGYVVPQKIDRESVRKKRNVSENKLWIVCSCGGGKFAENFILKCFDLASTMPEFEFDIVAGPLSKINWTELPPPSSNCRVHLELHNLAEYHSSCDILICAGGYNSTMEGLLGGAQIIVYPNQKGDDDEQKTNALKLSKYYPICLIESLEQLKTEIEFIIKDTRNANATFNLDFLGSQKIRNILIKDLEP